jgi:hypothetical protein
MLIWTTRSEIENKFGKVSTRVEASSLPGEIYYTVLTKTTERKQLTIKYHISSETM